MPHRTDPNPAAPLDRPDPFDRFVEMWEALLKHRRITSDVTAFRFTALVLATAPGEPNELVERSLEGMRTIKSTAPAWNTVMPQIALLLSAAMVKRGDDPASLWPAIAHTRELLRAEALPRNQAHEAVAAWVFRSIRSELLSPEDAARLAALYQDMKGRRNWFTNATDYPMCAYLAAHNGSLDAVAPRIEALYQALRKRAKLNRGGALQTAAQILAATGLAPELAADRAAALVAELAKRGERTRTFRYDELAMMCFISLPVAQVADLIIDYHERAKSVKNSFLDSVWVFPISVSLCFLRTLGHEPELETLSDLKAVLDMLAILASGQ